MRCRALMEIELALARMNETNAYIHRDTRAFVIPPGTRTLPVAQPALGRHVLILKLLLWLGYGPWRQASEGGK